MTGSRSQISVLTRLNAAATNKLWFCTGRGCQHFYFYFLTFIEPMVSLTNPLHLCYYIASKR